MQQGRAIPKTLRFALNAGFRQLRFRVARCVDYLDARRGVEKAGGGSHFCVLPHVLIMNYEHKCGKRTIIAILWVWPSLFNRNGWRPTEPGKVLPGVLFQDDDQRWMLHLDGSFEELPSATPSGQPIPITLPDGFPVLLGLTSANRYITAFGCDTQGGESPHCLAGVA